MRECGPAGGQSAICTSPPPYSCSGLTFMPTATGCWFSAYL